MKSSVQDMLDGQLLVKLEEDWKPDGLDNYGAARFARRARSRSRRKRSVHLKPVVIFSPTAKEFEQGFATTKNYVIVWTLDNVQQRAYIYTPASGGAWTHTRLPVPKI